jgi:outer membrane protein TolC
MRNKCTQLVLNSRPDFQTMFRKIVVFIVVFAVAGLLKLEAQSLTLDYFLQTALQNSPQLNDYRNQMQSGSFDSLKIRSARKPQINLIGQVLVAPSINGYGYDNAVTNTGNYELLMSASQTIFNKQILAPQYENIRLQSQAAGNSVQQTEHDLRRSITSQYILAYSDLLQISYASATLKLLEDEGVFLKQLLERGLCKPFDYTSFLVVYQSQQINLRQQEIQFRTDMRGLNMLCGITDTARHELAAPALHTDPKIGFAASRFLTTYRIDSFQISNKKLLAAANYKPRLSWFADAGVLGTQPVYLYRNFGTSFGLNFSMPIYDGKQKNLEYKKLNLAENTRITYQQFFKKQVDQEVSAILRELQDNDGLLVQTNQQLKLSEEQIRMGKSQLNVGAIPVTDFILAVRNYTDIKNNLNQLQVKQMLLTNELSYWNW